LKKIKDYNKYVEKIGRTLRPTDRGKSLCEYLNRKYDQVISYEYTAKMEAGLSEIERESSNYEVFLAREFDWLREPYEIAFRKGWLDDDKPSPAQIELLKKLAGELGVDILKKVFKSKIESKRWIDKLIKNGVAYELSGNVYLDVLKSNGYGKLSGPMSVLINRLFVVW